MNKCPLCAHSKFSNYRFGLVYCGSCGLVFSKTAWTKDANEQMEDDWFGEDFAQKSSIWVRFLRAVTIAVRFKDCRERASPAVDYWRLEWAVVRCLLLPEKGFRVEGIDLSEPVARAASKDMVLKFNVAR